MRSYETARKHFSALEIFSWCVVAAGVLTALGGAGMGSQANFLGGRSGGMALLAALPGLRLAFLGYLGVIGAQIGRAGVDSAEYGQQALAVAREQLAISRNAAIREKGPSASSFAEAVGAKTEASKSATSQPSFANRIEQQESSSENDQLDWDYRGKRIHRTENGFLLEGQTFTTLDAAKEAVDRESRPQITQRDNLYYVGDNCFLKLENAQAFIDGKASRTGGGNS